MNKSGGNKCYITGKSLARRWFLSVWLLLFATVCGAQGLSDQIAPAHQAAIGAVSRALEAAPDRAAAILRQMDFTPQGYGPTWAGFAEWPSLRKVEAAYMCAVRAGGAEEGQRFLQLYSRIIAADHTNAIRYEPALKSFFPEPPASPIVAADRMAIRFQALDTVVFAPTESIRDVVLALERYVERVPGGLQSVMRGCCNLAPADVYEVLRTSDSRAIALTRAIETGRIPPELRERLLRAIEIAAASSNAVRSEPALAAELQELNRRSEWRSVHPVEAQLTPRVGDLPAATQQKVDKLVRDAFVSAGGTTQQFSRAQAEPRRSWNQQRYAKAIKEVEVPDKKQIAPGRYTFSGLTGSAKGFGGLILGNSVSGPAELKPIEIIWVPEIERPQREMWGHFDFVLTNNRTAYSRRFLAEDAYVALQLLRKGSGQPAAPMDLTRDEGIGIAGGGGLLSEYYVHPELQGLSIGDAAILVDARGHTSKEALRSRLNDAQVSEKILQQAEAWRSVASPGGYKIIDVPMTVELSPDGLVRVVRANHPDYPAALRASSRLTFIKFKEETALPENATPFYEVLPALAATFPEFWRINDFAEVFALVRWASLSGANIRIRTPEPKRNAQYHYVETLKNGDLALSRGFDVTSRLTNVDRVDRESRDVLAKYSAPPAMLKRSRAITLLRRDMIEHEAALTQLARLADSPGEARAALRAQELLQDAHNRKDAELRNLLDPTSVARATLTTKSRAEFDARLQKISALTNELKAIQDQLPHSWEERLAHMSPGSRASTEKLLAELRAAKRAYLQADSGSAAEQKAEAQVTKLEAQLGRILEGSAEKQLQSRLVEKENEVVRAEEELSAYMQKAAPWLFPWMSVQEKFFR